MVLFVILSAGSKCPSNGIMINFTSPNVEVRLVPNLAGWPDGASNGKQPERRAPETAPRRKARPSPYLTSCPGPHCIIIHHQLRATFPPSRATTTNNNNNYHHCT